MARKRIEAAAKSYAGDQAGLKKALLDIARTTLSSKILTHDKDHFAHLAVDAVLRLKGSTNLDSIHIIKKAGGTLKVGPPPVTPQGACSARPGLSPPFLLVLIVRLDSAGMEAHMHS